MTNEQKLVNQHVTDEVSPVLAPVGRRGFLRITAAGAGLATLGSGLLSACGGGGSDAVTEAAMSVESPNCTPTTWNLTAGQTNVVGTVTVSNDNENLYITYQLNQAGCTLCTLHAWVGTTLANVPSNPQGIPVPGQFPYKANESCASLTSYTFSIPLNKLLIQDISQSCNEVLFVFAHAEVICNGEKETAFGGDVGVNIKDKGRWYYYGSYILCCDEDVPPETKCETAFAKGGYVFTTDLKSNPEKLPSLKLSRNRWGWAINLSQTGNTTYSIWSGAGLNRTTDNPTATLVGTLVVTWDGAQVTVEYVLKDQCGLKEIHIYAADAAPATVAPGQYGFTKYFLESDELPGSFSTTLPLADTNEPQGVWLIAHAVVCCECQCTPS